MNRITEITIVIRSRLIISVYQKWIKKNNKVLDVGSGNGVLSAILKDKLGVKITCCDIEYYLKRDLPFVLINKETKLPFADSTFDIVMFNDSLHHMSYPTQVKLLTEAFRVANKVLIFEDEPNLIETIIDWGINKVHNHKMPIILTFRNQSQWIKLFKSLGVKYQYKKVKKPILYPLFHVAFCLYKK